MEFNTLQELGAYLKAEREKRGIAREEVAFSIKISNRIIQALEEGDEKKLPARTYLRGFVQNYARYLGLDVPAITEQLLKIVGSARPQQPQSAHTAGSVSQGTTSSPGQGMRSADARKSSGPTLPSDTRKVITIVIIAIVVIIIFTLQHILEQREQEQSAPVQAITGSASPLNILKNSPQPSSTVLPSPSATAQNAAAVAPTSTATASAPTPTATAVVPSPTRASSPSPTFAPSPSHSVKPTATPKAAASASPSATAEIAPPAAAASAIPADSKPQEVILEALDTVTLKVQADNAASKTVVMNVDQIQTFKAKATLKITISNGGAVNVIHNGADMGVPGNLGQGKTLSFP